MLTQYLAKRVSWVAVLRSEPTAARIFLHRLIGPTSVWIDDETVEVVPLESKSAEVSSVRSATRLCELGPGALTGGLVPGPSSLSLGKDTPPCEKRGCYS